MGIFSKVISNTQEFNILANAVSIIVLHFDLFEKERDLDTKGAILLIIGWNCVVGVMDVIERNNWGMRMGMKFYADINGHRTRMSIYEAYSMTVGKLISKSYEVSDEIPKLVEDVLDKGPTFYKVDAQMRTEEEDLTF